MLPVWTAQLLTQEKSFRRNPIIGNRWLNERGLHAARLKLAHRLGAARRARLAPLIDAADREQLDRDGFIVKYNFLPADVFARLAAETRTLRAPIREMVEGDTVTRRIGIERSVLRQVPAARHLFGSSEYRNLISYAGASTAMPMFYIETILAHATPGPRDPQTVLHSDTFHPTVKAWLYVNDSAADAMPFTYVPGSHKLTPARLAWEREMSLAAPNAADPENREGSFRIEPRDLATIGLPQPQVLAGTGNTLIIADTFGFHARGLSPEPTSRIEIWAFGRRNPFLPWTGLDPWSMGGVGLYKAILYWRALDFFERLGIARQRWRKKGEGAAFDPPL
jgi:hypothetical protein